MTSDAPIASQRNWFWNAPYFAVGLFAVAMLALVWGLQKRESDLQNDALGRDVRWAEQTMRLHMQGAQDHLVQLSRELAEGTLDRGGFQVRATQYIANNPELASIVWVDAGHIIRWTAPFETTEWIAGEALAGPQPQVFIRAHESGRPTYGEAYVNHRGTATVELYVPVQRGRAYLGAIVGVYSVEGMVRHLVPGWFADKYRLSIIGADGRMLAVNSTVTPADESISYAIDLDPPGNGVMLRAVAFRSDSGLARFVPALLIVGLTLVVVWSLWALRTHFQRRVQVEKERDRLFNLSLDMLGIVSLDGTFRRVNPAFERILGHASAALVGRPLLDFVHPDDTAATVGALRRLAAGEPASFENRCRSADGRYLWLLWSLNPVLEEQLLYAVAHDITGRREDEEKLKSAYAFRKAMGESLVTGLRAIDLEGRIIFVNPAFCRMIGWSEQELIGIKPPFPYWPPEAAASLQRDLDLTLAGQAPAGGFEMRIQRRDGERFDVRMYISPLIDSSGRQLGWMASMNDITEPKRARAELEAAHERFVAVLDGLDTAVYVADVATDEILYANRAFKNLYGFDAVGRNCWQVTRACCPERGDFGADPRRLSLEQLPREIFDGEIQHALSGRWHHLRDRAIRWVDGRVVRMEIATDITDRKRMEEAALQHQERLEQTSRLITMGEMASSLAHELNQPLSAIANYCMGCVNRLASGEYRREDILTAMQKASAQAERAGKIIRRMREFVKKSEPNRAPVVLAEIVDDAVGFAEIDARKAGVAIRVDIPADLPPVFADRIMIEQVVLNLVKNGIEAMQQARSFERELTVTAKPDGERTVGVAVADRGTGIDAGNAEQLFVPFFTTKPEGMGMGLNICRSIIEYHGGRLWAQPNPGGGSVFRFTLPIRSGGEASRGERATGREP
ncbi:MAG: PAS domain-containing sensor histidine kinase [Rhodocyclaceae bacterium]|nr:PAS domain-containing sensor histidine kinase [Rhodocyclaceae bacterium]